MTKLYYAVNGFKVLGVLNSWNRALKAKPFINGFKNRKFHTFEEAEYFCLSLGEKLLPDMFSIPDSLPYNFVLYTSKLTRKDKPTPMINIEEVSEC